MRATVLKAFLDTEKEDYYHEGREWEGSDARYSEINQATGGPYLRGFEGGTSPVTEESELFSI